LIKTVITILSIVIAVIGIIAPILWDNYKTKTGIELQLLAKTTIVEKDTELEKLQIYYENKPIANVSKMTFSIINIGSRPIIEKDLITPPTLLFPDGVDLLDVKIDNVIPKNLITTHVLNKEKRAVELRFPLLNPADLIKFSIIISGNPSSFEAHARIYDIKGLTILDRTKELDKQAKRRPWTLYPVSIFTSLSISLVIFAAIPDWRARFRIRNYFKQNSYLIPKFVSDSEYINFTNNVFPFLTNVMKNKLAGLIKNFPIINH